MAPPDPGTLQDPRGILDRGLGSPATPTESRSLFPQNPEFEDLGDLEDEKAPITGCDRVPYFAGAEDRSDAEIERLFQLSGLYYLPGCQGVACLFKMARSIHNNLFAVAKKQLAVYFRLLERLIDIRDELKPRTLGPYKLSFDVRFRRALPKQILTYPPFGEYQEWVDNVKAHKRGKATLLEPIPLIEKKEEIAEQPSLQTEFDVALEKLEQALVDVQLSSQGLDDTPEVKKTLRTLSTLTLKHIERQTGVRINPAFEDRKLIEQTEIILYHSVYTVVLDKTGNPSTLGGKLEFPILVPRPGSVMERHLPPPGPHGPMRYISVQKYGFGNFWLGENTIKKMLFGGIGALIENYGGGIRAPHAFQQTMQSHLNYLTHAYAASIVCPTAVRSNDVTLELLERKFPELVETVIPYMVREVERKAKDLYKNWEETAKNIGKEIVKNIIKEAVKDRVKTWLIKKVGAKVIPLINMASSVYDAFAGDEERMRVRNAIGCILLHVKGSGKDDLHIAAKTLAQILADMFQEAIIEALVNQATQKGVKVLKRGKADHDKPVPAPETAQEEAPDDTGLSKAVNPPKPEPAAKGNDSSAAISDHAAELKAAQLQLQQAREIAEKLQAAKPQQPPPAVAPPSPATPESKPEGKQAVATRQEMVQVAPGVFRRPRKQDQKETTPPSHDDDSSQVADADDTSPIEDSHRALTQRGAEGQTVPPSEVDEVRRSRHVRERNEGNEDTGDSAVLAKNMKKEGRVREGPGEEAHHIIPGNEPGAAEVVKILAEKGIGINEGFNGVFLPRDSAANVSGSYKHEFTFSNHPEYFVLLKGLVKQSDSPDAIRGKIRVLGGFLANGELPTYRQVIEKWNKTRVPQ